MAVNLTRKTIVAAQTEATYGTDATPATNTNTQADGYTQLVYGDGAGVYQTDTTMIDMPSLQATLSPQSQIAGRSLANVSLQACLCQQTTTSGAATAIPYFDPLLMACGMDSDATAPGSAFVQTYTPTSTMGESGSTVRSATIVAYQGGAVGASAIETRATGVYMNADFNLTAGQAPTIQFTGQGKYVAPAHIASVPATTYLADTKVLVEAEALTIQKNSAIDTPTGNTLSPICRSISFSTGNSIIERGDVNSDEGLKGLQIISRAPTLNLVIEAEDKLNTGAYGAGEATGDFYAGLKANTLHKVTFTHGSGVANVNTTFTFPNAQLTSVNMSDDGGIRVYNLAFALIGGAAGDDEYSIAFSTEGVS